MRGITSALLNEKTLSVAIGLCPLLRFICVFALHPDSARTCTDCLLFRAEDAGRWVLGGSFAPNVCIKANRELHDDGRAQQLAMQMYVDSSPGPRSCPSCLWLVMDSCHVHA